MNNKKRQLNYIIMHMLFWCGYVVTWSYTAVYLEYYGFDNAVVGMVTGVGAILSVILQPLLALAVQKADAVTTKKNIIVLKMAAIAFAVVMWLEPSGKWVIAVLFMVIAAIDAAIPSMLSSLAMEQMNAGRKINYGLARGCGSIVFALFSLILGYVIPFMEVKWLVLIYAGFSLFVILSCLTFSDTRVNGDTDALEPTSAKGLLKKYPFLLPFLLGTVLLFMGHNMINIFLLRIIQRAGGSSENLGVALAIAAILELPVMGAFDRISQKVSINKILIIAASSFVIKCVLTYLSKSLILVYAAQTLQLLAFGLYTPASVYFINKSMDREDSGVGQALLGAFSLGLGGAIGNILGGFVIERAQVSGMLAFSVLLSIVGWCFILVCVKKRLPE